MEWSKEERMYYEFIRKHYRRILFTIDSNINIKDMTDTEATEELSGILIKNGFGLINSKSINLIYIITSIAASIIIFWGAILLLNYNEDYKIENSHDKASNLEGDKKNNNELKSDSSRNDLKHYKFEIAEQISLPQYYSEEQEIFGFNQNTEKKILTLEALFEILKSKYPSLNLQKSNKNIFGKLFNKVDSKEYDIEFIMRATELKISIKYYENNDEQEVLKQLQKLRKELEVYFREIAR